MPRIVRRLTRGQAIVQLAVRVSTRRRDVLASLGDPCPPAIVVPALIDTGATSSMIDNLALAPLGIESHGYTEVHTASTRGRPEPSPVYDVWIGITDGNTPFRVGDHRLIGMDFSGGTTRALIGCDVLAKCHFGYHGAADTFWMDF